MAIYRFYASQDNTITNGYGSVRSTRATDANMGASDVMEIYSLYGAFTTSSLEKSRALLQFDTDTIIASRSAGTIPASGSSKFYLQLFNTPQSATQATDFKLTINAVSRSWDEGIGLDMDEYLDKGVSNWLTASYDGTTYTAWTTSGSDIHAAPVFEQTFTAGTENLEIDITHLVEQWIGGTKTNYGVLIKLSSSYENGTANTIPSSSYYTKKFFARGTEYYFKRPRLEVRWDDSLTDDTSNFYLSSSRAPAADNLNTLYFYNYIRGQLANLPTVDAGSILVSLYSGSTDNTSPSGSKLFSPVGGDVDATGDLNVTGGYVGTTGIYSASFAYVSSSVTPFFPVWHSGSVEYFTGSAVTVETLSGSDFNPNPQHVTNITNLQGTYGREKARFRVYTRDKDWSPTIYTVASKAITAKVVDQAYYQIKRTVDDLIVVHYGTGSGDDGSTKMSYDKDGNYFDFRTENLEPGYQYELAFVFYENGKYTEQSEKFLFRVEY